MGVSVRQGIVPVLQDERAPERVVVMAADAPP